MKPTWEGYRRRRRAFRWALVLTPLWFLPEALARKYLLPPGLDANVSFFPAVALPAFVTILVPYLRWVLWPCPRCGRPFHSSWFYGNPFSDGCIHCDLPLRAPGTAGTTGTLGFLDEI